jgi:hypothetical protein
MKIHTALLAPCLALASFACATPPSGDDSHGVELIGENMQAQPRIRYSIVDASPQEFLGKTVIVDATVKAVCQNAGCWMQIEDGGHTAMVRWFTECGGKYSFPKDAAGKRVLVQGTLERKHTDKDQAEHMETEAGRDLAIPTDGYELDANSVLIFDG